MVSPQTGWKVLQGNGLPLWYRAMDYTKIGGNRVFLQIVFDEHSIVIEKIMLV
jgi:hypothetical protein